MKTLRRFLAVTALLAIGGLFGLFLGWKFLARDACLDAGGAWNARGSYCLSTPKAA
ncbi:MAG: hypothetical protein K2X76_11445 [Sphingomonas sp.]|nr:hypothetical protein [Sphingomonas sp.]